MLYAKPGPATLLIYPFDLWHPTMWKAPGQKTPGRRSMAMVALAKLVRGSNQFAGKVDVHPVHI